MIFIAHFSNYIALELEFHNKKWSSLFWESSDIWHGNWFYKTQDLVPESGPWPNLLALFPPCNCPLHLDINIMLCDTWMAFFLHFSVQNPLLLLNMLGPRATAATRKFYPTLNNAKKKHSIQTISKIFIQNFILQNQPKIFIQRIYSFKV